MGSDALEPTPRKYIVSTVPFWEMSRFGTVADSESESLMPWLSSCAAVTALTAIGTFCNGSDLRWAVTTIS